MRSAIFFASILLMATQAFVVLPNSVIQTFATAADPADHPVPAALGSAAVWKGMKVLPKLDAVVRMNGEVIDDKHFLLPWTVQDVDGDLLFVGTHRKGWVQRSEVMTLDEAAIYCTEVINKGNNNFWAYNFRALAYQFTGNLELAIADYGQCLRISPVARVYNNRGTVWNDKKEYDRAIADFSEAIKLAPNDAPAFLNRGNAWHDKKNYDNAIANYNKAIRIDESFVSAYNNRGNAWRAKKEVDKAIADYDHAILLDPNSPSPYINLGNVWLTKKDYDQAIAFYDQAIALDGNQAKAYYNLGLAWERKRHLDKALDAYNQAIRLDPNHALSYCGRGDVLSEHKEYDKAILEFNRAVQLDSNCATGYYGRGNVWCRKKDYDNAIKDYDHAICLDPTYAWPYNATAWLRATCPDERYRSGAQAIEFATKACELTDWKEANNVGTLGAANAEAGEFESAIKYQQMAIDLNPNDAGFVKRAKERLALYGEHKPYRE